MNTNTAAIESLRAFAEQHGELSFAHLCTAALQGEQWAIERLDEHFLHLGADLRHTDASWKLDAIRSTDCTRPDGAIARGIEI